MKVSMSRVLLIFFIVLLLSCAPTYKTIVKRKYSKGKIVQVSLIIAPFNNEPYVSYFGDVTDEFGEGEENELILKHFKDALKENLRQMSTFSSIDYAEYETQPVLDTVFFNPEDMRKFRMALPKESTILNFKGAKADFVLFFQDLTFGTYQSREPGYMGGRGVGVGIGVGVGVGSTLGIGTSSGKKNLRYEGKFAVWDNRKGRVAVYGRIKTETQSGFLNIINMEHWEEIDHQFATDLLYGTPFMR